MSKQKLYGNNSEPRCETCALGKRSADGSTVLCRRVGAVPLYHHCRHFVYDPLRRTPHRDRPLEVPDAAAFSLDELIPSDAAPSVQDSESAAILDRLQAYLRSSEQPDAATILALLNEEPAADAAPEPTPEEQQVLDDIDKTLAADADRTFDENDDIFGDLERLNMDMLSSTRAAFQTPDFELSLPGSDHDDEDIDDDLSLDATATLTIDDEDDDDAPLLADDLILLSATSLADDPSTDEELVLNPDGSITTKKADA